MTVSLDEMLPDPIGALMDKAGLTQARLIKEVADKLKTTETKFFQYQGAVVTTKRVKALGIQLQALDMALKLRKMYPDPKLQLSGELDLNIRSLTEEQIDARIRELAGKTGIAGTLRGESAAAEDQED